MVNIIFLRNYPLNLQNLFYRGTKIIYYKTTKLRRLNFEIYY